MDDGDGDREGKKGGPCSYFIWEESRGTNRMMVR